MLRPQRIGEPIDDPATSNEASHSDLHNIKRTADAFETLFVQLPIAVAITHDRLAGSIRANPAMERMLRLSAGANMSKFAAESQRPSHFKVTQKGIEVPADQLPMQRTAATGLAIEQHECHLEFDDGAKVDIWGKTAPLLDENGQPAGAIAAFIDVTPLRRAEREIMTACDETLAASLAKDRFLAMLSHELRTPLTPVMALLDKWRSDPRLPDWLVDDVRTLRRNVELEARLIDDLLDLQRIAHGKFPLQLEICDLHELIHAALEIIQSDLHIHGIQLAVQMSAEHHTVSTDCTRLQQVIWNVLKNAAKFTPKGGRITVSTENSDDGKILVRIRDSGIGMTAQTLQRMFKPFEQGDDPKVGRAGGLGLGLAIAKQMIDLLGGTIEAASDGPGCGSLFTISLPTIHDAARHQAVPVSEDSQAAASGRILLVEDHQDTSDAICFLLQLRGYEIKAVDNITEAAELLRNESFDLLLSDIGLPDGTGLDLIAKVRSFSQVPAVALTGYSMPDDIARCHAAGFDAHLTKPFNLDRLELTVKQSIR